MTVMITNVKGLREEVVAAGLRELLPTLGIRVKEAPGEDSIVPQLPEDVGSIRDLILKILAEEPLTANDLSLELSQYGLKTRCRQSLYLLRREGLVEKLGSGKWRLIRGSGKLRRAA